MSRTPLEQLEDQFEYIRRFVFDHNEDIRKLKAGGPHLAGFLFALTTHVGNLLSMIPDAESYPIQFRADVDEITEENLSKMELPSHTVEFLRGMRSAHERVFAQFDMRRHQMNR